MSDVSVGQSTATMALYNVYFVRYICLVCLLVALYNVYFVRYICLMCLLVKASNYGSI